MFINVPPSKNVVSGLRNKQENARQNVTRYGKQKLTIKEDSVLANEKRKMKIECPNCRHLVNFYAFEHVNKKICRYCGIYVFKDKKDEFNYKMKQKMKEVNENEISIK